MRFDSLPSPVVDPRQQAAVALGRELSGLFDVQGVTLENRPDDVITFTGRYLAGAVAGTAGRAAGARSHCPRHGLR